MLRSGLSVSCLSVVGSVQVNLFQTKQRHQEASFQPRGRRSSVTVIRLTTAQLNEPNIPKIELNVVKKRLFEAIPEEVKQVPWKKAEKVFLNNLLGASVKALKFVFIPLFFLSFLCDVIFSILKNKELLIPIGLFIGCALSDFLNETFQDFFRESKVLPKLSLASEVQRTSFVKNTDNILNNFQQDSGSSLQLLYISGLFVVTRIVCSSLSLTSSVFLMHIANGGLMQAVWLWRNSQETSRNMNFEEDLVASQNAS